MKLSVEHSTLKTNPGKTCSEGNPIGIAHLASFDDYLIINNIDHNTEISIPHKSFLKPAAIFNQTIYADNPENAGFDLDIHAVFYHAKQKSLSLLNHYGQLRFLNIASLQGSHEVLTLKESANVLWLPDSEQCLLANNCLISTSPGDYHVQSLAKPGLFISSSLSILLRSLDEKKNNSNLALEYSVYFAEMGNITAIAIDANENLLAVAAAQTIIISQIIKFESGGLTIGSTIAEFQTNFHCTFLSFFKENLIAAGHDLTFEETVFDPSSLKGGGFTVFNTITNKIKSSTTFTQNLAWGNGSLCLTVVGSQNIFALASNFKENKSNIIVLGLDRHANLWAWHPNNENPKSLILNKSANKNTCYGIAHLAWHGQRLFCGFNRDGNRLHSYEVAAV